MKSVNQLATSNATISKEKEEDCNCKGSSLSTAELTAENLRVLRLLEENGAAIQRAIEDVILKAGIKPEDGERFRLTTFRIVSDSVEASDTPVTTNLVGACCPDGSYQNCYTDGCDPCVGHY